MARRPRSRASKRLPKTLTGLLASVALAVLAALGVKSDGFHGKPSAPPTERPPAARTTPPPGDLPRTPSTFTAAKKALYDRVYADHRVTFYCGCRYEADRRIDLASCGLESLADKPRAQRIEAEHLFPAAQFGHFRPCWRDPGAFPACAKRTARRSLAGPAARRWTRCSRPPTTTCSTWCRRWGKSTASAGTTTGA